MVAYKRWSFRKNSNCKALTGKMEPAQQALFESSEANTAFCAKRVRSERRGKGRRVGRAWLARENFGVLDQWSHKGVGRLEEVPIIRL